jgi:hypothetical protein
MSSDQRIKLLEKAARIAIENALATRKKLAAAVEADGDVFVRPFLTLEEHSRIVRRMRSDHRAEMERMIQHFMCPDPAYMRIAKFLMRVNKTGDHQARRDALHVVEPAAEERAATADAIVRAGRRRRNEED